MIPKIDYIDHESGAGQMKAFYPDDVEKCAIDSLFPIQLINESTI
jgi:hypothetical protein